MLIAGKMTVFLRHRLQELPVNSSQAKRLKKDRLDYWQSNPNQTKT